MTLFTAEIGWPISIKMGYSNCLLSWALATENGRPYLKGPLLHSEGPKLSEQKL
jgi:hypothetical protein